MAEQKGLAVACMSALLLGGCYQGIDGDGDELPPGADPGEQGGDQPDQDVPPRVPPQAQCGDVDAGETPLRRLTRAQYNNTIRDLLGVDLGLAEGFISDEKIGTFDSNAIASVTELGVEQYMDAAELAASEVVLDLPALLPCDPAVVGEAACAEEFIAEIAPRAYRRPLTDEQLADAMALYQQGLSEGGFSDGIRLVVQGLLQSPFFLYHLEDAPGTGEVSALSSYEVASRLSYFLWESMPDDALFAAAEAGELHSLEAIRAQAERMIADERASDAIRHFHTQWLALEELETLDKDAELFPEYSPSLAASMQEEVERFADHVIREEDARLETLMTASFTLADAELAEHYGVSLPGPGTGFERVELPEGERSGLLTMAGVMAAHSHHNQTSPVLRGILVRENFLCQVPEPPPDTVDDNPPALDPSLPTRERWAKHREDPVCAGCHMLLDPLGLGLENYDAVGRYRTTEGELPIDASGEIVGTIDINGEFDGPQQLAAMLVDSEQAQQCVATQWFRYALGRLETEADQCSLDQIYAEFEASGFDIRELMVSIAVSDALRNLKTGA